ncbi:tetratricopeptide repeat protein [Marinicellulosiphila megalodicopiae]|uniref:tetratricopeptide repeat protein n=1 Tax=Marinicellulosiphila megalodicopiae TaxID=2724896 RepID=UPI003BAE5CA7
MKTLSVRSFFLIALLTFTSSVFANRYNNAQMLDEIQFQVDERNWLEAKSLIDFFQNSTSKKNDMAAYQINKLESLVLGYLKDETPLYNQLKNNYSIRKANDYLDQYPFGKHYEQVLQLIDQTDEEQNWINAKTINDYSAYEEYLNIYPNGKYRNQAKTRLAALELSQYERAINKNTASAYNRFLFRYPNSQYRETIENKLAKLDQEFEYQQLTQYNSISGYEDYLNRHPQGPYTKEIKKRLLAEYLDSGDFAFSRKNYQTALKFYTKFLNLNTDPATAKRVSAKVAICRKYQHQVGGLISMVTMDTNSAAGYSFFKVDPNDPGFYFSLKFKPESVNVTPFATTDDQGNYNGDQAGTVTGNSKSTNFTITTGMTYSIRYPFWAYMGAGFEFKSQYDEVDTTDIFNDPETIWARNTDQERFFITPEAGFIFKQDGFALNYGVRYSEKLVHQIGLGVVF